MGFVVNSKEKNGGSGVGTWTGEVGANQENDLIAVFAVHRNTASTLAISGYTAVGTQQSNDACVSRWFVKKVGASPETTYTVTATGTSQGSSVAYVIRDADVSGTAANAVDGTAVTVGGTGATCASPTLTTGTDNCLLLHAVAWDQTNALIDPPLAGINLLGHVAYLSHGAWFKGTAGAIDTFTWDANTATNAGTAHVIAIKNGSGGDKQIRLTDNRKILNLVGGFSTLTTAAPNANPPNVTTINAVATGTAVATVASGTPTTVPWPIPGLSISSSENLAAAAWVGAWISCTSADIDGKPLSIAYGFSTTVDSTRVGEYGIIIAFADASGNWAAYQLMQQADMQPGANSVKTVLPGTSSTFASSVTETGSSGVAVDFTAVTKVGYFYHRKSGQTAAVQMFWYLPIYEDSSCVIVGGGSENYISTLQESRYLLGGKTYVEQNSFQGAGQIVNKFGIQYGNGTDATYVKHEAQAYGVPNSSDASWNLGTNAANVVIYGSASCVFDFSASSFANNQKQSFTIHASSSTSATYNFVGCSLVGWDVTWKTGVDCVGATFSQCGEIDMKGADISTVTIKNTTNTDSAVTFSESGGSMDSCTIDVTGTSAAYHIELGTAVTAITLTDVTFTGTPVTDKVHVLKTSTTITAGSFVVGAHYRIKTVGTTDFTAIGASANTIGINFTATGAGTGTGDAYQAVKITISGTTSLVEADVTTAGAPAWVAAPEINQVVVVSGFTAGSRIQIYDTTSSTELFNGTASAGDTVVSGSTATWTDPLAASADRAIRIRVSYVSGATAKNFIETSGLTCGQTAGTAEITYPVTPTDDTVYNANAITGSGVTGVTFTDAATDVVNINVVANAISWKTIYAAWVYYVFGATGIASDIDYIDAVDEANYILSNMIIKNTSSPTAPLEVTGGYGRDSVTGATIDLADTTGGTLIFAPDHVVSYAVGSGVTAQDITDIAAASGTAAATATLAAAQTTPIHSDVRKVVGITVDGTGTDGDPWGP